MKPSSGLLSCCAALVASAAVGLLAFGASTALAEECPAASTTELEECVKTANEDAESNTIKLAGGPYTPVKTLAFKTKTGTQTIEGPETTPEAELNGTSLEAEHPELVTVAPGSSVVFKRIVLSHAGHLAPAIEDGGTLEVERSTIAGNVGNGLVVLPAATATLRNSTVSDGAAEGLQNGGTTTLENVTVAFNKGLGIESLGTLNMRNTIVAENGENVGGKECSGAAASVNDHNLSSDNSCGAEINSVSADLGPLFNDGGPTALHSLQPASPALGV